TQSAIRVTSLIPVITAHHHASVVDDFPALESHPIESRRHHGGTRSVHVERAHLRAARTARKTPRSIPVRARRVNREAAPGPGHWRAMWPRPRADPTQPAA